MIRYLLILPMLIFATISNAAVVNNITITNRHAETKIQFTLSDKTTYASFLLKKPNRAVLDLDKSALGFNINTLQFNGDVISKVRTSRNDKGRLRLVFDLKAQQKLSVRKYAAKGKYYITVNLQDSKKHILTTKKPKKLRKVNIVIDPGHGGKDPGAIGKRGSKEKNIVLSIAKKLKKYIDRQPGMRAILTRKGDYYVGLRKRLDIARKYDADVFISIHADAFKNRRSSGASVFALSQRGATSEAARWLAEKENYSELGGVDLSALDDKSGLVRSVLIDLSQTATIGASLHLGESVLDYLDNITQLHHSKVEQARFVVLKSPDIPSILIETGFISNRKEERNLRSSRYQTRLALSVFRGLKKYFWQHPPPGTLVEAQALTKSYRVVAGDSLSKIAYRFNVSMQQIKKKNKLKSSQLKIGQLLKIPPKKVVA